MYRILYLLLIVPLVMGGTASKKTSKGLPERGICAHRGAMETHPENTLAAFKEAVFLGAHMIEFDVRLTKDGHLVILHDETVDRTTNGMGKISELTLHEVKQLDAGSWKSEIFTGEKIPTLQEVLIVLPENIWLNIHLNYCCTDEKDEVRALFKSGVDFILTDRLSEMLEVSASLGIEPLKP